MNVKDKLDASLSYLIDDGKDQGESSRFTLGNIHTSTPQVRGENKKPTSYDTYEVPVNTGKQFTHKTPNIQMIVYRHYIQYLGNIYLYPKRKKYY